MGLYLSRPHEAFDGTVVSSTLTAGEFPHSACSWFRGLEVDQEETFAPLLHRAHGRHGV